MIMDALLFDQRMMSTNEYKAHMDPVLETVCFASRSSLPVFRIVK